MLVVTKCPNGRKVIDSVCVLSGFNHVQLCNVMDCSPPGSSVHGILQARLLEGVAMSSSRGSSPPRDQTYISCISYIAGRFFTTEWFSQFLTA